MRRGSYGTPEVPEQRHAPALEPLAPRVYVKAQYGHEVKMRLDPAAFVLPRLAAQLADKWLEIAREVDQGKDLLTACRDFLQHIGSQLQDAVERPSIGLSDLRRRHLDAWELDLLARHRARRSDTTYRRAVYLFALLRRVEADAPGTLHWEVVDRLEKDTRLQHVRNDGWEPFPPDQVRKLRGLAHRQVHAAVTRGSDPTPDVLVALHVLTSLATGEAPEVLRALTTDDIEGTASPEHDDAVRGMTHAQRLTWLAERDLVERYALTLTKNRSAQTYDAVYTRRDHAAHQAITRALQLTGPLRGETVSKRLWLYRRPDGTAAEAAWNTRPFTLRAWASEHGLPDTPPWYFARLRKVVTTLEALANPGRYLHGGRRHTAATFFGHYANSPVLRAQAGRIYLDAVEDAFEAAVQGPTVVTPAAEELLAEGQDAPGLDRETAAALLRGDLEGPQAACRNPTDSPYEPPGEVCTRSMTGTCFGCGNALITRHHLPAALVIAEMADPARSADPAVWLEHWKPIHDALTLHVLPAFSASDIEQARALADTVPLHPGTRNDMRGTQDAG